MPMFEGTGVALVTPFNAAGEIDFDALKRLLEHTSQGVDYFVVQGTTGESVTITSGEKAELLEFVKANNSKNLPIVYGIGGNNTAQVLSTITETDLEGVSGILSVSPYYNKPPQEGIYQHFSSIADASPVPVILYNVPGRTSSNIAAGTTLRLAMHENIAGIKEASGDLVQCQIISRDKPADFQLISGDDMLTIPLMSIGGAGVISVLANAFPVIFNHIVQFFRDGDIKMAYEESFKLLEINPLMYAESNPVGVKEALKQLKICENYVRLPLVPASKELSDKIEKAIERLV